MRDEYVRATLDGVEPDCVMEFDGVATGYVIYYRCRSCDRKDQFHAPELDNCEGPSPGHHLAFRGYTYGDASRLLRRIP